MDIDECINELEDKKTNFSEKLKAYNKATKKLDEMREKYNDAYDTFKKEKKKEKKDIEDVDTIITEINKSAKFIEETNDLKIAVKKYFEAINKIDSCISYLNEKENIIKKVVKKNKKIELKNIEDVFEND